MINLSKEDLEMKIRQAIRIGDMEAGVLATQLLLSEAGDGVDTDDILEIFNKYLREAGKLPFTEEDMEISYQILLQRGYIKEES